MPIVTGNKPNTLVTASVIPVADTEITSVLIADPTYRSTVVDLKWISRSNLLSHIEGSTWKVDYYSQVIDTSSGLSGQQYTKNAVYQSYKLIKNLEMKVSAPLSTTQDPETKAMTLTGTAILLPSIIPNEGDVFIADIGEGKVAIFRITDSTKKSIFKEACYEINYGLNNDSQLLITDLDEKVIETTYYQKDFLTYGQNPIISNSDNAALLDLRKAYSILAQQYFKKFFSNEFRTIMIPGQEYSTYDHFLVDYLLSTFSTEDSQEIRYIRKLNVDDDLSMKADSIWKAMKYRDVSLLNTVFKKYGLVSARTFTSNPVLEGICYSGINNVVYPADPVLTVDYMQTNYTKEINMGLLTSGPVVPGANNSMVKAINIRNATDDVVATVYPVTVDDYYVLSANFYNSTITQSVLEKLVYDYLSNTKLDNGQLLDTAKNYTKWGVLEQCYYIPIILTLIQAAVRGI